MTDVKLVKLKSGEEIVGDVTVVGDSVAIANPCQIMPPTTRSRFHVLKLHFPKMIMCPFH